MTSYWTEVGGDFILQWLLFILKIVHQPELPPQKVKKYWATNRGGRTLECKWCHLKGHCSSNGEKTVGGGGRQLESSGYRALLFFTCLSSSFRYEGRAESLVLSHKNENLPDSILRCLTQVRRLWLEIYSNLLIFFAFAWKVSIF